MSIPSEEVLINALNHQIRRDVLQLLQEGEKTYSMLLNYFAISTGKLNYHLKLLEGLLRKDAEGRYALTPLGKRALEILGLFREEITEEERPLIRDAFISQKKGRESFLHLMFVSRMKFKFYLLMVVSAGLVISSIAYLSVGGSPLFAISMLTVGMIAAAGAAIWVRKIRKLAPEFVDRVEKFMDKSE
jgi:hypothetical protein